MIKKVALLSILICTMMLATWRVHGDSAADEARATHPVVSAYAETFNVSEREAQQRLELQVEMMELADTLAENDPNYAGSWIQHQPDFRLTVAFTEEYTQAAIQNYLNDYEWAELVDIEQTTYSLNQLAEIQNQILRQFRELTEEIVPFESGVSLQRQKVILYTPYPDALQLQAETSTLDSYRDVIEIVFQESLSEMSSFLDSGMALNLCTTGFVLFRYSDARRFISTAGHCSNTQTFGGVNIGPVIFENNPAPNPPIGPFGRDMDFQTHDALAVGFSLRNVIQINPDPSTTTTENVVSFHFKGTVEDSWVCKNGRITNQTCGLVANIYFAPYNDGNLWSARYVRVNRLNGLTHPMSCPGDSGSPVYTFVTGGVSGSGIHSGGPATANPGSCDSDRNFIYYTPADEIHRAGHMISTNSTPAYPSFLYQHVFWSATNCTEHKTLLNGNGDPQWWKTEVEPCSTYAPGSGTIESYTTYVHAGKLHEAMWRNGLGYVRSTPLHNDGHVNWGAAPAWSHCCTGNGPSEQGAYVLGNYLYQHVFWSPSNCTEHKTQFDSSGNPIWGGTEVTSCSTYAPGSGTIESYTTYVSGGFLREAMWRNSIGYVRSVPLSGTTVNWAAAPGWVQCCSGNGPSEQALTY
jgi:predicted transcriptional regulator